MDDPSQSQQHSDDHPGSASRPESGSGSKSSTWTLSSSIGNSPQNVTNLPNPQTESSTRKRKESMEDHTETKKVTEKIYYKYWIEEEKSYGSKEGLDKKVDELHARFLKNMDKNVEVQDQYSEGLSEEDDVDGADNVDILCFLCSCLDDVKCIQPIL
ncbi:hypothetical protein Tco_0713555 [Tanacetum coccineum]